MRLACFVSNFMKHFMYGHSGLAAIFGYANIIFPNSKYNLIADKHIKSSISLIEGTKTPQPLGFFSGITGIAFSASYLADNSNNYKNLLASLDNIIFKNTRELTLNLENRHNNGLPRYYFDVISGISGVGSYLLQRGTVESLKTLEDVLDIIIYLTEQNKNMLSFRTSTDLLFNWEKNIFKDGVIDCGMAHGIAGPLSLLSLSYMQGIRQDGIKDAIASISDWIIKNSPKINGYVDIPGIVEVEKYKNEVNYVEAMRPSDKHIQTRVAWCYGNPGTSRAIYLAGKALAKDSYIETAIQGMVNAYKRIGEDNAAKLDSPTFCHGIAGVLDITLRFWNDTRKAIFKEQGTLLLNRLCEMYDENAIFRYKNLDFEHKLEDNCGMLEGTSGILLSLLAATTETDPKLDRAFLIS